MAKKKDESFKITATEKQICIHANPRQVFDVVHKLLGEVAERINHDLEVKVINGDSLTFKLTPKQKELGSKNEAEKQGECNG